MSLTHESGRGRQDSTRCDERVYQLTRHLHPLLREKCAASMRKHGRLLLQATQTENRHHVR